MSNDDLIKFLEEFTIDYKWQNMEDEPAEKCSEFIRWFVEKWGKEQL